MLPGSYSGSEKRADMDKEQAKEKKLMLQNVYRKHLDQMLVDINQRKEVEKKKAQDERVEFNERAELGKKNEKNKQIAYKNYYRMLMENQEQHQSSYINPYSFRENVKQSHISYSVVEGEKKSRQIDFEDRKRKQQIKNQYKEELLKQIEEKRLEETKSREQIRRQKEEYSRIRKLPREIHQYERIKQIEEMEKYREDLDRMKEKKFQFRNKSMSEKQKLDIPFDHHNALLNPLPHNIQNPYILKEIQSLKEQQEKRPSHLANIATQNFHYQS